MTDTPKPKNTTELLKQRLYTEQTFTLDDGVTEVTARVNDSSIERIRKYLPVLLEQRGLVSLDSMDESHPDVQKKLQARAKSNKSFAKIYQARRQNRNIKKEDLEKYTQYVQTAVQAVRDEQEPFVNVLLFQIASWAVLYEDLFSFDNGLPVFRIDDVEIPESYWSVGLKVEKSDDPLDTLLSSYTHRVRTLEIDRNNPLEWMLALVTALISDEYNPRFAEALQPIIQNTIYFVTLSQAWRGMKVDEAGFLLDTLVGSVPETVQPEDTNADGEQPRRRVRKAAKKAKPGGPEGSGESQEA